MYPHLITISIANTVGAVFDGDNNTIIWRTFLYGLCTTVELVIALLENDVGANM